MRRLGPLTTSSGLLVLTLGIIEECIWRINDEVENWPHYVMSNDYE
jgi:hypothetical protein